MVARRARSVTLLRSLREAASRPASSLASILVWKKWSTAIEPDAPPILAGYDGFIAIGLRAATEQLVRFLVLHEPMNVQFYCVIIKRLQLKRIKLVFPIQASYKRTSKISKGNMNHCD